MFQDINQQNQERFHQNFDKISYLIPHFKAQYIFSLNDLHKFSLFGQSSNGMFPYSFLIQVLCIYRFSDPNDVQHVINKLEKNPNDFWPNFSIMGDTLTAYPSAIKKGVKLEI
jgi:hypothetical protein